VALPYFSTAAGQLQLPTDFDASISVRTLH